MFLTKKEFKNWLNIMKSALIYKMKIRKKKQINCTVLRLMKQKTVDLTISEIGITDFSAYLIII